ncbi:amidohydrolase [Bittarella massiliensis]|uniref:Amidohydrolase n=1 Tax=Bittarella massiliensis (ex Durand et al. 2017) TaxID=1720313 RepID=A0AAQ1RVT2_9FIRM|nr:M20 family metallopeptidase [Bittarella massiliensis (ex Durand et al. 2017)]MZL68814.1 amidohydrolase [Bittarella massiliensis (ex Durand et al. 2017)]MZL80166.1 amidohydrolase [Bittarella massiliensis (ex Durand et al. 2017)]SHG06943.1 amidohydrolase [Bittarella massiliensis (ex Durand et al. 2017)]
MQVRELAHQYAGYVTDFRRELHAHPELSMEEEWTSARIARELEGLGIPHTVLQNRGIVAVVDSGRPGPRLAFRGDFDALPLTEEVELPFQSQIAGKMHACGHDAHAAMVLGAARIAWEQRQHLCGTAYFCFQPGEETGEGAGPIVAHLKALGGVDRAVSLHVNGAYPVGSLYLQDGPMYAGATRFDIEVEGVGGHGSRPDLASDPIRPACEILLKAAAIPVNRHDPFATCVVSPCLIHAGTKNNIIPGSASIGGNIRFFRYGDGPALVEEIRRLAGPTAAAYGCTARVTGGEKCTEPVLNDPASAAWGRALAADLGFSLIPAQGPSAASDNFAEFLEAFGGFYAMLGARSELPGTSGNAHNPTFCIDEGCLEEGLALFAACLFDLLGGKE